MYYLSATIHVQKEIDQSNHNNWTRQNIVGEGMWLAQGELHKCYTMKMKVLIESAYYLSEIAAVAFKV